MIEIYKQNLVILMTILLILFISVAILIKYNKNSESLSPPPLDEENFEFEPGFDTSVIVPIPNSLDLDVNKVALGEQLFRDSTLSNNGKLACITCHDLTQGGATHLPKVIGMDRQVGERNSPTVFNSVFNLSQYWDGRAETLEEQIDGPILNPAELGNDWPNIIAMLKKKPAYVSSFNKFYQFNITPFIVKDAIARFERSLITPDSSFDRYLRGDKNILSAEEIEGYKTFLSLSFSSYHKGVNLGSNLYQKFGIFNATNISGENSALYNTMDMGRFAFTGIENDEYTFKVPTLRNIALTAPYFHNGSAKALGKAVRVMGEKQLGRHTNNMVSFLKTLTGEYKGKPL